MAALVHESGIYFFIYDSMFLPGRMSSTVMLFTVADFAAHILALLVVAYCYRFLHQRTRRVSTFLAGWLLVVAIYYSLLVLLQSLLMGSVVPELPPLSTLYRDFLPEFQMVLIISTLILLALPARYRKPQWYEPRNAADQNREVLGVQE